MNNNNKKDGKFNMKIGDHELNYEGGTGGWMHFCIGAAVLFLSASPIVIGLVWKLPEIIAVLK